MKLLPESDRETAMIAGVILTSIALIFDWPFWVKIPLGVVTVCLAFIVIKEKKSDR